MFPGGAHGWGCHDVRDVVDEYRVGGVSDELRDGRGRFGG